MNVARIAGLIHSLPYWLSHKLERSVDNRRPFTPEQELRLCLLDYSPAIRRPLIALTKCWMRPGSLDRIGGRC